MVNRFDLISVSLNKMCLLTLQGVVLFHQKIANKTLKMHEKEGCCL